MIMLSQETKFWNTVGATLQPLLRVLESSAALGKIAPRGIVLPTAIEPRAPTSFEECETILKELHAHSQKWVEVDTSQRADLLRKCIDKLRPLAVDMAKAGAKAKGSYESGYGEEL
jgi:acyl-CoA reductase-like NAD-dependent aldehyde dehydrogenase